MKTKLLKEIRKRYSIERIDSIANNSDYYWKDYCDSMGFPFYYFMDSHNEFRDLGFKIYPEAYEHLLKRIKIDYSKYSTHGVNKQEKVWRINSNKK